MVQSKAKMAILMRSIDFLSAVIFASDLPENVEIFKSSARVGAGSNEINAKLNSSENVFEVGVKLGNSKHNI